MGPRAQLNACAPNPPSRQPQRVRLSFAELEQVAVSPRMGRCILMRDASLNASSGMQVCGLVGAANSHMPALFAPLGARRPVLLQSAACWVAPIKLK
eukprot:10594680-Prorocentrum_lima.AAC.1